jgi:hypothetical protein
MLSGGRVSNTWITYPRLRDNRPKGLLIRDKLTASHGAGRKGAHKALDEEGSAAH